MLVTRLDGYEEDVGRRPEEGQRVSEHSDSEDDDYMEGEDDDDLEEEDDDNWSDISSGIESSLREDDEVIIPKKQKTCGVVFKVRDGQPIEFVVGHMFDGHKQFKDALKDYSIKGGYNIRMTKNDLERVTAVCGLGCPWRIHASKLGGQLTFMVKTLNNVHTCLRVTNNKAADSKWISTQLGELLEVNPSLDNATMIASLDKWGVEPPKWKLQRARRIAREKYQGSYAESYSKLQTYCNLLLQLNPGSTVKLQPMEQHLLLTGKKIFSRVFVCLNANKEGFLNGCRPWFGIDGCHLKGPFGGTLLAAVSLDGNNSIFPIAWAIVDVENGSNWGWFLELLHEVIALDHRCKPLTIMSDGQKGLGDMVEKVFSNANHKRCCRHISANLKSIFPGRALHNLFWAAARATTRSDFNKTIAEIKLLGIEKKKVDGVMIGPDEWLMRMPPTKWSRYAFDHNVKSIELTNNVCEVFNNWIIRIREQPIIEVLDKIRQKLMVRWGNMYNKAVESSNRVAPGMQKKIQACTSICRRCKLHPGREQHYEVIEIGRRYAVNLNELTCSCNLWQLSGLPCIHATASIIHSGKAIEDLVNDYFTVSMWRKTYESVIYPFPDADLRPENPSDTYYPPILKRRAGRPRKQRRREDGETTSSSRTNTVKCGTCGREGHNKRSCQGAPVRQTTRRRGRPSSTSTEAQESQTQEAQTQEAQTQEAQTQEAQTQEAL